MKPGIERARRGAPNTLDRRQLPKGLVRRVWRQFGRPYRSYFAALLVCIVGSSALAVAPPVLSRALIDDGVLAGNARVVTLVALASVALALGSGAFSLVQRYFSSYIGEHLILDMRTALYDHVQRMPLAFFTRTQTGALISRLNNDVLGAQRALTGTIGTLTANVVQVVVTLGVMFSMEWRLTLLVLTVLPVFAFAAKKVSHRLQDLTRDSMRLNADMNTVMTERFNVSGAQLVKLFGRPDTEAARFGDSAEQVAGIGVRSAIVGRLFFVTLSLLAGVGTAAVYWLGGLLALNPASGFTVGELVAFAALTVQAYSPLSALTNAPVEVLTALVSFERVFEVLDVPSPIQDAPDAVELRAPQGEVVFDHVVFAYPSAADSSLASLEGGITDALDTRPGDPVLHDMSFVARPGQTVALVGPSGAGKTTICNLVPRLYDVSGGRVCIDGLDVRQVTLQSLADAVGVVSQDPHLFHDTVLANLRYARPSATDPEVVEACRQAQIHHVIAALPDGYDTLVGERGYRLSGGEKQRLALARVLLRRPAVVVLDEATSHLDSESEAAIQRALTEALHERTSLVIAHRLSTVVNADQILVVQAGRIVQRGTHDELVRAEGLYAALFRTQFASAG